MKSKDLPAKKIKVGGHKRCSYGLCKSDSRTKAYYELGNFYFIRFPKPCIEFRRSEIEKKNLKSHLKFCRECAKSDKWVKLCGRRDKKFNNMSKVTRYSYICSLHFPGEAGPTEDFPDPISFRNQLSSCSKKISKIRSSLQTKYLNGSLSTKKIDVPGLIVESEVVGHEKNSGGILTTDVEFPEVTSLSLEKEENTLSSIGTEKENFNMNTVRKKVSIGTQADFKDFIIKSSKPVGTYKDEACQTYVNVRPISTQTSKKLMTEPPVNKKCHTEKNLLMKNITEHSKVTITRFQQSLENNEKECLFYTGLRFKQILILLSFLGPAANNLIYWNSKRKSNSEEKKGRVLTPLQELIIVLVRLRCGFLLEDMSYRFRVSVGLLSSITTTWIQFMFREFRENLQPKMFASREQVQKHMPLIFKKFENLRVIIDCTEFFCESPGNFEHQGNVYSQYKGHTTFKVLIGCTPNGGISFVSDVYEGSISDRDIVIKSKLADHLHPGDVVLADRGFTIADIVQQVGARLNIPPFLRNRDRLTAEEEVATKKIAKERIYVEHAVGRLKQFRILQRTIPLSMRGIISQLVFVCACLVNFEDPIVFDEQ